MLFRIGVCPHELNLREVKYILLLFPDLSIGPSIIQQSCWQRNCGVTAEFVPSTLYTSWLHVCC